MRRSGCKYTPHATTCQACFAVARWAAGLALLLCVTVACGWVEALVRVGL